MRSISLIILATFFLTNTTSAQVRKANEPKPIILGRAEEIRSVELNEYRTVNIYFPPGYNPNSDTSYPVIYLLDGSENEDFIHMVGLVQFLNMIDTLPKSIVVGIANVDRKRDFTFPTTVEKDKKAYPTTGGSEKFIAFIEKELQPFIQKKFKAGTYSTLIGQSLGGLLATEILLKKPSLFNNYLIVSPSLWWDNESLLGKAPKLLETQPDADRRIYLAVGAEGKEMEDDAKKLADLITASGKKKTRLQFVSMPEEDHKTILHNAAYHGLEALFSRK